MSRHEPEAPWRDRVARALAPCRGLGVVVAVSGGSDSVGLLRWLHDLRDSLALRLSVAHLDHGTRGEIGRADAAFVADLTGALGLPFDLGHWSPSRPGHFESDARKARYAWLAGVAKQRGADFVAVGHTRDDQAETILHRIVRGTGLRGLAGIPARRVLSDGITLIRPLLDVSRDEIRADLASRGQPFREDATNTDLARTRNKIRHDLLPKLAHEYNPRVAEAIVRLGGMARDVEAWFRGLELHERSATLRVDDRAIDLSVPGLNGLPGSLCAEVIRRAWRRAGWPEGGMTADQWLRLARTVGEDFPTRYTIVGDVEVVRIGDRVRLSLASDGATGAIAPISLEIPGEVARGNIRLIASLEAGVPCGEAIDLDRIFMDGRACLWVRSPIDGDRFDPLGLGGKTQSLNDFFRGRGVPKGQRPKVPVVCDATGIVWVVGHRIADRVKRTEGTVRVLYLAEAPAP